MSTLSTNGPSTATTNSDLISLKSDNIFPQNALESSSPHQSYLPSPASSHNQRIESIRSLARERSSEELLDMFRADFARQVPFITIPPHINSTSLAQERPYLYQAIITVTSSTFYHDSVYQIELGQQFLKDLTHEVVVMGKRNLDILQGLLVYITWCVAFPYTSASETLIRESVGTMCCFVSTHK